MASIENLKIFERTPVERQESAKKAGIASGKARREKKLLSSIYAEFLSSKYEVVVGGEKKKLSGQEYVNNVVRAILANKNDAGAKVKMLKEIREATEGVKTSVDVESYNQELLTDVRELLGSNGQDRNISDFLGDDNRELTGENEE